MAAVMVTAPSIETQPMLPRPRLVVVATPPPAVFRRRRLAAAGVLLAVFVLAILVVGRVATVLGGSPAVPAHRPGPTSYVVQPGDTLWDIARSLQPEGDVRPVVHGLLAANGGAAALVVGQVLMVP
jgi:nucleoid-associated protein YgaU